MSDRALAVTTAVCRGVTAAGLRLAISRIPIVLVVVILMGCSTAGPREPAPEPPLEALLEAAENRARQGQMQTAAADFDLAMTRAREEGRPGIERVAATGLARALRTLGDLTGADAALARALELTDPSVERADLLLLSAEIAVSRSDERRFEAALDQAEKEGAGSSAIPARVAALRGRVALDRDQIVRALAAFEIAVQTEEPGLRAAALANRARALVLHGELDRARESARAAAALARAFPADQTTAYLYLNISQTWMRIARPTDGASLAIGSSRAADLEAAESTLRNAEGIARSLDDPLGLSYALGYGSELAQIRGELDVATALARQAIFESARAAAPESESLWSAQLGRLHAIAGERERAIASYERAIELIEAMRAEFTRSEGSVRRFREEIAPVYSELVDLLLQDAATREDDPDLLRRARDVLERYKVAELRDYFRDECVDARADRARSVDLIANDALVLYPILLPDRLELLVTLPGGRLVRRTVPNVGRAEIERVADEFRKLLTKRSTRQYLRTAQQLHRWLIAPIEADLEASGVSVLVSVPGGALRGIPLAALHDGDRFLVERIALATIPGLELSDPRALDRESLVPLLAGLSVSVDGFPALEHVGSELEAIRASIGGDLLLDSDFSMERIEQRLRKTPVNLLHFATHAEFLGSAEESYLLAWDGRVTMNRLADYVGLLRYRDEPLDLIVLSACETAEGDDRAALGLSGVAVRAGARSAIGTLWSVNDAGSARLIEAFYEALGKPGTSKASALQSAQRVLLDDPVFSHPGYWAAFLLINGWR